jgi:hypothetical protein
MTLEEACDEFIWELDEYGYIESLAAEVIKYAELELPPKKKDPGSVTIRGGCKCNGLGAQAPTQYNIFTLIIILI